MHAIYVYPKGITGQVLGGMIEYAVNHAKKETKKSPQDTQSTTKPEIIYIDDGLPNQGLAHYCDEIKSQGAKVHLAWDKRWGLNEQTIAKLKAKLDGLGIGYEEDSMLFFAKKVASKLQKQIQKRKWKRVIGIELGGLADDKHIGFLDDELFGHNQYNQEIGIVYFCGIIQSHRKIQNKIKQQKLNAIAIFLPCFYLDLVDGLACLCKVSWTPKNPNVPTIIIGHALADFSNLCYCDYQDKFDYLCIGAQDFMPKEASTPLSSSALRNSSTPAGGGHI